MQYATEDKEYAVNYITVASYYYHHVKQFKDRWSCLRMLKKKRNVKLKKNVMSSY